jgi:hypothetical protein
MDKSQFEQLSVEKQNKMYSEYSKNRMSGKIDAYGREIRPEGGGKVVMVQLVELIHHQLEVLMLLVQLLR